MKKNKKQRFISDKISELRAEGKNQQESITIALSMAENVLQTGGTATNVNELITQSTDKLSSAYKPIKNIQKGVTDGKGKSGVYFYYRLPEEGGFDPKVDREFISNDYLSQRRQDPSLKNEALDAYLRRNPTQVFEEGGENELPKYQFGVQQKSYKDPVIGQFYGQDISGGFKGYDANNPIKTQPQFPSTTYNPSYITPQNNNNNNFSVGNLDLNNPIFTSKSTNNTVPKQKAEPVSKSTTSVSSPQLPKTDNSVSTITSEQLKNDNYIVEDSIKPEFQYIQGDSNLDGAVDENDNVDKDGNIIEQDAIQMQKPIQFANPYGGVDLNAASALFGQSLQQGDTLMGVASGAKLGLGLARNFMSGYSAGVDRNRVLNDYSSNMRNAMTGAETPVQLQEGGTVNEQDQLLQQVAMMLQQGASPEQVVQELVAMGMPQEQAAQMIQMVMQQAPQEEQMMQEGGVAKQPEVPVEMANAEIEDGEYVQDTEGVKYAEGAKHSEGGIPTQLENGARVLSDYKKVGKDLAKQLSEQVGFEVKASDTFATVLDKFNRKEGFDKKVKHLDEYSDKLEKQEKTVKHDATLALNKQILMEEAQEDTQKLQELVKQQEGLFNMLFEAQEASKGVETEGNFMQNGGTVNDLMAKYNISAEEAMKLIPSMQDAGTFNVPEASAIEESIIPFDPELIGGVRRLENIYEKPQYGKQSEVGTGYFGDTVTYNSLDVQKNIKRLHPELYDKYFKQGKIMPEDVAGFQKDINKKYDDLKEDYKKQLGEDSDEYKKIEAQIESDKFTQAENVKSFDAKFGDYTSTRPSYQIPVLPLDVFKKIQSEGINTAYELKSKRPDLYEKYVASKDLKSDFTLGANLNKPGEIAPASTPTVAETPMEIPTTPVVDVAQDKSRMAFLNLPDQTPMLPWAMQAPAMTRQTIYAPRWNEISPEQQLTDIQRGRVATAEQMSFLPDSQQASSLFALDANAMSAQNKVRSETERYNQLARERTESAEAEQKTKQSAADVVAAQTYQQQLGNELESNEADWRSWYNRLNSNQLNNFMTVNEYNRSNSLNSDVQFTGQGYEVINTPTYSVDSSKIPMTQEPTKKKKSTKRFGK